MMLCVGDTIDEWDFTVEPGKLRAFAVAVQAPRPDEPVAPPTFPVVMSAALIERIVTQDLKLDRSRTVHGEQRYVYFEPIMAGDELHCVARFAGDAIKTGRRGGSMRVVTITIDVTSQHTGRLVCQETMVAIEKQALDG
jgi:hypothetical protein